MVYIGGSTAVPTKCWTAKTRREREGERAEVVRDWVDAGKAGDTCSGRISYAWIGMCSSRRGAGVTVGSTETKRAGWDGTGPER